MSIKRISIVKLLFLGVAMLMLGSTITLAVSPTVSWPVVTGAPGTTQTIPVTISNLGALGVSSGMVRLYEATPAVAIIDTILPAGLTNGLPLTNYTILKNSGEYRVAWASATEVTGSTVLFNVVVKFIAPGTTTITSIDGSSQERLKLFNLSGDLGAVSVAGTLTVPGVSLSIPTTLTGTIGSTIQIPVNTTAITDVAAYQITLTYNSAILRIDTTELVGTLSAGGTVSLNKSVPGTVTLGWAKASGISGASPPPLIYLVGTILGKGVTGLTFTSASMEPLIGAAFTPATFNGMVTIPNATPEINGIPDKNGAEGSLLTFTVTSTDLDGDVPTYSVVSTTVPTGYTFNASTGVFNWTPGYAASGTYTIQFQVDDGNGGIDIGNVVTITIANTNRLPSLALNPTTTAYTKNEGETLTIQLVGTDADVGFDGDVLTYSMVTTPTTVAHATLNSSTGAFNWPIAYDQAGTYTFIFSVTDSRGATSTQTVTVAVNNTNNPPVWSAELPDRNAVEGVPVTFTYIAIDPEGDPIRYTLVGVPPQGSQIVEATGAFTYTPPLGSAGQHIVQAAASDQINPAVVGRATIITVIASTPPVLTLTPTTTAYTVAEKVPVTFTAAASDVDEALGDIVTISASGTLAAYYTASTAKTGTFAWTPPRGSEGAYSITLTATDLAGRTAVKTVTVNVTNAAPVLTLTPPITSYSISELSPITFNVAASDADEPIDTVIVQVSGAQVSHYVATTPKSGTFAWTPPLGSEGSYTITFTARDIVGKTDVKNVTINVAKNNMAPVFTQVLHDTTVSSGTTIHYTYVATDANPQDATALRYSLTGTVPSGASIDAITGALTWLATAPSDQVVPITVTVVDGSGATATTTANVTITQNRPPVITAIPPVTVNEGANVTFTVVASDPDAGETATLVYSYSPLITGATFINHVFSWTPGFTEAGSYPLTFTVTDVRGMSATATTTITVVNVNRPPNLVLNPVDTAYTKNEGQTLAIQLVGSDADIATDADVLTYSMVSTPTISNATLNAATGAFSWPINYSQAGSYTFVFTVKDIALASASKTVTVTVNNVETAPSFVVAGGAQLPDTTIGEGQTLTFTYIAIDAEGDPVTYTILAPAPTLANIDFNTGVFTWKPSVDDVGTHTIVVQASDGILSTASRNTKVTVTLAPPAVPALISPAAGAVNQPIALTLTWGSVPKAASYHVQLATDNLFTNLVIDESGLASTSKAVASLLNNTQYFWRVSASNVAGTSAYSGASDFTTIVAIPAVPVLQTPAAGSTNQPITLTLTWGSAAGATGYRVQVATDILFNNIVVDSAVTTNSLQVGPLAYKTQHFWRVSASNIAGSSGYSSMFDLTTIRLNHPPIFTAELAVDTVVERTTLSFTYAATDPDVEDAVTFSLADATSGAVVTAAGVLSWTPTFAQAGHSYVLKVIATDGELSDTTSHSVFVRHSRKKGDVDGSGIISTTDVTLILQYIVGRAPGTTTFAADPEAAWAADVTLDGTVSSFDASYILQYLANRRTLPPLADVLSKPIVANGMLSWGSLAGVNGATALPLKVKEATNIYAIQIKANIGSLQVQDLKTNLPNDWMISYKAADGKLLVAAAGVTPISDGDIATICFKADKNQKPEKVEAEVLLNENISQALSIEVVAMPTEFALENNYPNPFNPTTTIKYQLPQDVRVSMTIYNIQGQIVRTLVNEDQKAGYYTIQWDGRSDAGTTVATGIYIYRINAGSFVTAKKMVMMK